MAAVQSPSHSTLITGRYPFINVAPRKDSKDSSDEDMRIQDTSSQVLSSSSSDEEADLGNKKIFLQGSPTSSDDENESSSHVKSKRPTSLQTSAKVQEMTILDAWKRGQTLSIKITSQSLAKANTRLKHEVVMARLFEAMKQDPGSHDYLTMFISLMPKADLHTHLTGALYAETLLELACEHKLYCDLDPNEPNDRKKKFKFYDTNGVGRVSAIDLFAQPETYSSTLDWIKHHMSMDGIEHTGKSGAEQFFQAFNVIESIARYIPKWKLVFHAAKSALSQRKKYVEQMMELLPSKVLPSAYVEAFKTCQGDYSKPLAILREQWIPEYVEEQLKVLDEINTKVAQKLGFKEPITHHKGEVVFSYIQEIMRSDLAEEQFFAQCAAAMELQSAPDPRGVVALNIVGPEHCVYATAKRTLQNEMLGFLSGKYPLANLTLHAGELNSKLGTPNALSSGIRDAILIGKAKRVGHCVGISHEPRTLKVMEEQGTAVEVCPSSNYHILNIPYSQSPFHLLRGTLTSQVLCSDDEGVNRKTLNEEYVKMIETCEHTDKLRPINYKTLQTLARSGLHHSFLPGPSIYEKDKSGHLKITDAAAPYLFVKSDSLPDPLKTSKRALVQFRFERSFVTWEAHNARRANMGVRLLNEDAIQS